MHDKILSGLRILVVEDEFFLADDLERSLSGAGATVVGPAANVTDALQLIASQIRLDAASLDVNLGGDSVYPVAERLEVLGVPFLFVTGYNERDLPARWKHVPRLDKGLHYRVVVPRIMQLIAEVGEAELKRGLAL